MVMDVAVQPLAILSLLDILRYIDISADIARRPFPADPKKQELKLYCLFWCCRVVEYWLYTYIHCQRNGLEFRVPESLLDTFIVILHSGAWPNK